MADYTFVCPDGHRAVTSRSMSEGPPAELVCVCDRPMKRDYRADSPQLAIATLHNTNDPKYDKSLFLPEAKDFAGPKDPDGNKGMRDWNEKHVPRPSNKAPSYPKTEKVLF